jgi:hypothetical protein
MSASSRQRHDQKGGSLFTITLDGEAIMNRLQDLIDTLSDEQVILRGYQARRTGICKICSQPANSFRTPFSELEYQISSICQQCQDYYYLNGGPGENA